MLSSFCFVPNACGRRLLCRSPSFLLLLLLRRCLSSLPLYFCLLVLYVQCKFLIDRIKKLQLRYYYWRNKLATRVLTLDIFQYYVINKGKKKWAIQTWIVRFFSFSKIVLRALENVRMDLNSSFLSIGVNNNKSNQQRPR